jgi:hypothetical protein
MSAAQVELQEAALADDERAEAARLLVSVRSDEAFPWPPGKAPWLRENGGSGMAPPGALENFGNRCSAAGALPWAASLPSPGDLRAPRTLEEARRMAELGSALLLAGLPALRLRPPPVEEQLARAGAAALRAKLGRSWGD